MLTAGHHDRRHSLGDLLIHHPNFGLWVEALVSASGSHHRQILAVHQGGAGHEVRLQSVLHVVVGLDNARVAENLSNLLVLMAGCSLG